MSPPIDLKYISIETIEMTREAIRAARKLTGNDADATAFYPEMATLAAAIMSAQCSELTREALDKLGPC
jgi:hypothetical protein